MISKRERLEAAIAGEVADRPPVALWRHFPVDDQAPETLAKAIAFFQRGYDFDFIKVTPASSFCLKDWGVEDAWRGHPNGTRDYTRSVIRDMGDWRSLQPLEATNGSLGAQLRCLDLLRAEVGADAPILQTVFSPLAQAKNLAGKERLLEHLHHAPQAVLDGLEVITRSTAAFIEQAKQLGIDGIFYAVQHASYAYFDPEGYARFGKPYDQRLLETAGDLWLNVLHMHGEALMFDVAEHLPAHVVNWHDRETAPDLAEGKARVRGAVCGGVSDETIWLGSPERVRAEAQGALLALNRRGVILGTGCVIPTNTPHGNIMAVRDAVECA